ncbi:response regulator [Spirosoma spitsbergense]|uniref:response regulator n=1 Tax=Spirosoma spitsbergense TaxID=431554 RepID=UPI00036BCB46|nr:response regulator [Spirosoma spitsbergense]
MNHQLHILIVEDEAILALDLKAKLEKEGYRVVGVAASGKQALALFAEHPVDLLLCDIHIKGDWDGIETAQRILAQRPLPLIYLTAYSDKATLERAGQTTPLAYIVKPVHLAQLRVAIDMAMGNFARQMHPLPETAPNNSGEITQKEHTREIFLQGDDALFVKVNYQFVKIKLSDILYLEAEDAHTMLVTIARRYALRLALSMVVEQINEPRFVRIHRSFVVNIEHIDAFTDQEVSIQQQKLPLGRSYKEVFMKRFRFGQ